MIGLERATLANENYTDAMMKMLRYQGKYNCIRQDHKVEASVKDCIDIQDGVDEIDYFDEAKLVGLISKKLFT